MKRFFLILLLFSLVSCLLARRMTEDIFVDIKASGTNGWYCSNWYGWFNETHFPWVYSPEHGWQYFVSDSADNIWIWSESMRWTWTSEQTFPWIYDHGHSNVGSDNWAYYYNSGERWFYNRNDGWIKISPSMITIDFSSYHNARKPSNVVGSVPADSVIGDGSGDDSSGSVGNVVIDVTVVSPT